MFGSATQSCKCLQHLPRTLILNYSKSAETKVVELPLGKLKGKHETIEKGLDFYSFEGIPYAKAPLGDLRFRPSQPIAAWKDVLDCTKDRPPPLHFDAFDRKVHGSEDCLYLNVYTKHFNPCKPLPVLMFIFPGGFKFGGATRASYGPELLMREDLVYVAINYRLCGLGFLSVASPKLGASGNAGLHDQLTALRWVKKFIMHFNGDPGNITLMGLNAGAASTHFLMSQPKASGLFQRAIMMSGSMLNPWVMQPNGHLMFCKLLIQQGYKGKWTKSEILKYLRSLDPEQLASHDILDAYDYCFGHLFPFVPVMETQHSSKGNQNALLNVPLLQMMKKAWGNNIPLLIGATSFEGLFFYPYVKEKNSVLDLLMQEPALLLPYNLYKSLPKKERDLRAAELVRFFYGSTSIPRDSLMKTLNLFSYKLFWHGVHRTALSRIQFAKAPTFLYRFDVDTPGNVMRNKFTKGEIKQGVCHADDLGYLFPMKPERKTRLTADEKKISGEMVQMWITFARTGNPNCKATENQRWMQLESDNPFMAMSIGKKLEFKSQPEKDSLAAWNKAYNNEPKLLFGG